ncbi:MAG: hypothetical protein AB7E32_05020 [Desulfovibrio sp.]
MKKGIIVMAAVWLVIALCGQSRAGEVWRLASLEWPPYAGRNLAGQGSAVSTLRALLEKQGIGLEVEFFPWARAKEFATTSAFDGYYPAWPEEVEDGFVASDPVASSQLAVMTFTDSGVLWKDLETLFAEQSVGLVRTYVYPQPVPVLAEQWRRNVLLLPDEESLIKKLSRRHMTVAITDPQVMLYLAGILGIDNVRPLVELERKPLVVAFRASQENLRRGKLLNELLNRAKSETSTP